VAGSEHHAAVPLEEDLEGPLVTAREKALEELPVGLTRKGPMLEEILKIACDHPAFGCRHGFVSRSR